MTTTITDPDVDLDTLDVHPPRCTAKFQLSAGGTEIRCPNEAQWLGRKACCGGTVMHCDECRARGGNWICVSRCHVSTQITYTGRV